jgi:hypothetical protein
MAMVGDNPNAHIDPEVISPLSKLQGMMGGNNGGGGTLTAKIGLHDLEFALIRQSSNSSRLSRPTISTF